MFGSLPVSGCDEAWNLSWTVAWPMQNRYLVGFEGKMESVVV